MREKNFFIFLFLRRVSGVAFFTCLFLFKKKNEAVVMSGKIRIYFSTSYGTHPNSRGLKLATSHQTIKMKKIRGYFGQSVDNPAVHPYALHEL